MMKNWMLVAALVCAPLPALAQTGVIDATTAGGERVRWLPDGRTIYESEKDYNRGSLNPKTR